MLNENNYQALKTLFSEKLKNLDLDRITNITGIAGANIYNVLIEFINKSIDNYNLKDDISYVFVALLYLEKVLVNFISINKKRLMPKLAKIYEKSARLIEEHGGDLSNDAIDIFNNICNKVRDISFNVTNSNGVRYEFLFYLVTNHRNLNLIGKLVDDFNMNINDKDGNSLFINILKCYLNVLDDSRSNENDILYYNNIVRVIVNRNRCKISDREKAECLRIIYQFLDGLSTRDRRYDLKKEQCDALVSFFKREFIDRDILSNLSSQYNIETDFDSVIDDAVISKSKSVDDLEFKDRRQVSDYIVSIDGKGAYEIDDALSCSRLANGRYLLGVHISDVLSYMPYSSYVIRESIRRANTIYLSDNYIPMLPTTLIDRATLCKGEYKLANSYYFEISSDFQIVRQWFEKTIIKNSAQLSYEKANKIINSGSADNFALRETLINLNNVSDIISGMYSGSALYMALKEKRLNVSMNIVGSSVSEKIVNNAMMLTNNRIAEFFYNHRFPFIYRVHQINKEKQEEIMELASQMMSGFSSSDFDRIYEIIRDNYPLASYALAGSHEGLRLNHYTHATSPLRRGADIVATECLNRCYFGNPTKAELENLKQELSNVVPSINETVERTSMFVWDYERNRKLLRKQLHL